MLSQYFNWGAVPLGIMPVFVFLSWLTVGFIFWRKGRQEHHNEYLLFDVFLQASLAGLVLSRVVYILFHLSEFGWNIFAYFDLMNRPGLSLMAFGLGSIVVLFRFAKQRDWDNFEILDFWVLALSAGMVMLALGWFIAGVNFGHPTTMPWGVNFEGVFDKRQPTQLFTAVTFLLLLFTLSRVEYKYRTFKWYKAGKSSARSGFLFAFYLIAGGAYWFLISFFKIPQLEVMGRGVDWLVGLGVSITGLVILMNRRGRVFSRVNRRRAYNARQVFQGRLD